MGGERRDWSLLTELPSQSSMHGYTDTDRDRLELPVRVDENEFVT